jgi:GNAT superfamily N-acetyltransferase
MQWGDLADDSWAFEEDGRLIALGWVFKHGDVADGGGYVHPDARGRGFGTDVVERSEDWARRKGFAKLHVVAYGFTNTKFRSTSIRFRLFRRKRSELLGGLDSPPVARAARRRADRSVRAR